MPLFRLPVGQSGLIFQALDSAFLAGCEELLLKKYLADGASDKSGTTALVALVHENKVVVAHVGDSRGILSRRGRAEQVLFRL
ncbi:hypothetical protein BSKO_05815 [Bryopsis sp. KO-2023]|nr:hypothetical protein BSKO_05815 [Bryopsis sp. KO-2023]